MNTQRPTAGLRDDRDIGWMEATYPLRQDWIDAAVARLAESNARATARRAATAPPCPQERLSESDAFHTRVTGPIGGYYIASHACRSIDMHGKAFIGAFKICATEPSSYWTAQSLRFGSCRHTETTGVLAMESAESSAARVIATMAVRAHR